MAVVDRTILVVWKDAPGFTVQIGLKEGVDRCRQSAWGFNAIIYVKDGSALSEVVAEEMEMRLQSI